MHGRMRSSNYPNYGAEVVVPGFVGSAGITQCVSGLSQTGTQRTRNALQLHRRTYPLTRGFRTPGTGAKGLRGPEDSHLFGP